LGFVFVVLYVLSVTGSRLQVKPRNRLKQRKTAD
jgi:hypothetical protein